MAQDYVKLDYADKRDMMAALIMSSRVVANEGIPKSAERRFIVAAEVYALVDSMISASEVDSDADERYEKGR